MPRRYLNSQRILIDLCPISVASEELSLLSVPAKFIHSFYSTELAVNTRRSIDACILRPNNDADKGSSLCYSI